MAFTSVICARSIVSKHEVKTRRQRLLPCRMPTPDRPHRLFFSPTPPQSPTDLPCGNITTSRLRREILSTATGHGTVIKTAFFGSMMAARNFRDNHGRTLRRSNNDANALQPSSPRSARTVEPRLARPGRSPVPDVYAQYTMNRRGVRRTQWREQGSWVESDADDEESHEGCEIPEDGENAPEEAGDGAAENGGQNNDGHQEEMQDGEQQAPEEGNDDGENDDGEKAPDGDGERGLRWESEEAAMRARTSQRVEAWLSNVGDSTPLLHPEAAPSPDAVTDNGEDSDNDSEGGVPINVNTLRQTAPAPNRNVLMPRRGGPTNINNRRDEVAPAPNPNVLMPRGGYPNLPLAEGTRYRTRSVTRAAAAAAQAAAATLAPGQGYVAVPVAERHAAQLSFMADEDELEDEE